MVASSCVRLCAGLMLALIIAACAPFEPKRTAVSDFRPPVHDGPIIIMPAPVQPITPVIAAKPVFMLTGQQVMPPMGFVGFCLRVRSECTGGTDEPLPFALTPKRRAELVGVNAAVNALPEVSDKTLYRLDEIWTYARDRGGDCEDLALEKRRRLMALGWPADALLMATGKDQHDEGHAVLIATTAEGDFVLDNRESKVRLWTEASYRWLTRQSRERPFVWLSIDEPHFSLRPIAFFPPLNSPASFLDQTITVSLTTAPSVLSASLEERQEHLPPELRK
ncbi:MAG: transglutaminase-like cysteine peptidase [Pseudomonadota bacterium]